jgi:prepilin-type N-terminal cleavage/methylation domain-containing protein
MRRKNGFTLIELLAVIIILGVIMLIAIPSVTQQITNSRKNSYVDTAQQYINAVVTKVNEGNISMFDTKRLYLVPVGNDDTVSCVSLESGGASPFSRYYKYAYVAVHYTGKGYDYWFLAEDAAAQGFKITSSKELEKSGKSNVVSGIDNIYLLQETYTGIEVSSDCDDDAGCERTIVSCKANSTECPNTQYNILAGEGTGNTIQASAKAATEFKTVLSGFDSIEVFDKDACNAE